MRSIKNKTKILTFLSLGFIGLTGTITGTTISLENTVRIDSESITQTRNLDINFAPIDKNIATIKDQKIVDAINAYEAINQARDDYSKDVYHFISLAQDSPESSLVKLIQTNIKYFKLAHDDNGVYTLPSSAIKIAKVNDLYHVSIDLISLQGFVNYYQNDDINNPKMISNTTTLSFNAYHDKNHEDAILNNNDQTLKIVSLTAIILGAITIILFLIYLIKREFAKRRY